MSNKGHLFYLEHIVFVWTVFLFKKEMTPGKAHQPERLKIYKHQTFTR